MKTVSIIIPARNEESTIGYVLDELNSQITSIKDYDFEVIVVADHCDDNTELIAAGKQASVYFNERKPGKGNALITGLTKAKGEIMITLDADGSHEAKDIHNFIHAIEKGAYLVVGSRARGGSDEYVIIRLLGNILGTWLANLSLGLSITDAINGYKAFRKEVFDRHRYQSSGFEIEIEFLYSAVSNNYSVSEIASHERKRMGGVMKSQALLVGLRFLIAIIKWGAKYRLHIL